MSVNGCLREAADRIDAKGWNQHAYGINSIGKQGIVRTGQGGWMLADHGGKDVVEEPPVTTCVIGAIRCAAQTDDEGDKAKAKLAAFLGVDNLSDWNDIEGRTREQVSAALRTAAR